MTEPAIPIPRQLALELAADLQLSIRGGLPSPEHAANLLRRLNDAIRASNGPPKTEANP